MKVSYVGFAEINFIGLYFLFFAGHGLYLLALIECTKMLLPKCLSKFQYNLLRLTVKVALVNIITFYTRIHILRMHITVLVAPTPHKFQNKCIFYFHAQSEQNMCKADFPKNKPLYSKLQQYHHKLRPSHISHITYYQN